jgi:putative DNA-invertase from lambdoid prophage Rac
MIFTVLAAVAELERSIITERVHAEVNRARKEGKVFGRPKIIVDRKKVRMLHAAGNSVRRIATQMGLTKSTVFNIVNAN